MNVIERPYHQLQAFFLIIALRCFLMQQKAACGINLLETNTSIGRTHVRPSLFDSHPLISQTLFIKTRKKRWANWNEQKGGNNKKWNWLIDRGLQVNFWWMVVRPGQDASNPTNAVPFPWQYHATHAADVKQNTSAFYLSLRVNFMSPKAIKLRINRRARISLIHFRSNSSLKSARCLM